MAHCNTVLNQVVGFSRDMNLNPLPVGITSGRNSGLLIAGHNSWA